MVNLMKCQRVDKSCFACMPGGECDALDDTDWGGRNCPFYKLAEHDYRTELVFEGFKGRFKRVRGYEGKYYVSEYGQVINNIFQQLNNYYTKGGLPYVKLYKNDRRINTYLADLVADAWVKGTGKIRFKDGDPTNCNAQNLYREMPYGY